MRMVEHPELRPATPFVPTAEQQASMPEFRMGNTPRYLFRIHAPPSAGTTTTSYVIPPASGCDDPELRADLFSRPPGQAADLLYNHLTWLPSHEDECNFTSWTSSLLFALQYGFYRHRGDTMKIKSQLSQITIMVVDTRGLPPGTFVKDVEIMRAITSILPAGEGEDLRQFLNFRKNHRTSGIYYFGEYLSQGDLGLEGRCAQASMIELGRHGLFDLQPGFEDQEGWTLWAKRVIALRKPIERLRFFSDVPPTDRKQIRKAIVLASACFGDRFAVPVAAMLLALQPRKGGDLNIIKGFAAMFTDDEIRDSLRDAYVDGWPLPEVELFGALAGSILRHTVEGEMVAGDDLISKMSLLGVGP